MFNLASAAVLDSAPARFANTGSIGDCRDSFSLCNAGIGLHAQSQAIDMGRCLGCEPRDSDWSEPAVLELQLEQCNRLCNPSNMPLRRRCL